MKYLLFCVLALFVSLPAVAQQTDINRFTLYTGFDSMISPARSLTEYGFDLDFGVTLKPWVALGADFGAFGNGIMSGTGTIKGSETVYAPEVSAAGGDPSTILVPFRSRTYTFAAGPQFYLRKWQKITLFARPGLGGIHETADLTFPAGLGGLLTELQLPIPSSRQTATTWFVGVGGGCDFNLSRRVGLRVSVDWINTHLFSNLLTDRQNYARFTIGPTFRWGHL
jgi:hypothetical protein